MKKDWQRLNEFLQLSNMINKKLGSELVELGMDVTSFLTLHLIDTGVDNLSEISRKLSISPAGVNKVLGKFRVMKFIELEAVASDMRVKKITMTKTGKVVLKRADSLLVGPLSLIIEQLP